MAAVAQRLTITGSQRDSTRVAGLAIRPKGGANRALESD